MSRGRAYHARAASRLLAGVLALGSLLGSSPASADPSVWSRARDPELARRHAAMKEVEGVLLRYDRSQEQQYPEQYRITLGTLTLRDARKILEDAGALTSRDPMMRYRLAQVVYELRDYPKATQIYASIARSPSLPAPFRASALLALGTCYAHVGQRDEEIKAYTEALAITALGTSRATILANRAEAYMGRGEITAAIQGYREALAALSSVHPIDSILYGVTPLWGLGVALDRSGDLEGGIRSIRLAREYDPNDRLISRPDWFYSPPHDEAWYMALGFWTRARHATQGAARAEAFARAIEAWERYIEKAPPGDAWVPLAKARLRACEKERDADRKKSVKDPEPSPAL
jgi:tetratricopeptide (TPR) repeat protein